MSAANAGTFTGIGSDFATLDEYITAFTMFATTDTRAMVRTKCI